MDNNILKIKIVAMLINIYEIINWPDNKVIKLEKLWK